MTWFGDLRSCPYFGDEHAAVLRAVGWLERGCRFSQGACPASLVARLLELRENLWEPDPFHGWHECTLCPAPGPETRSSFNLFVPAAGVIFVCPEGILHYVQRHDYLPPRAFLDAVAACPPMRSQAYFEAIAASGGSELLELNPWPVALVAPALLRPAPPPVLTREAYLQIRPGMTVCQVEAVLGPGNVVSQESWGRVGAGGVLEQSSHAVLCWWEGARRVTITFANGGVVEQHQHGLD